eukprot:1894338-Alexandrium_andersonii.AAC.1
MSQRIDKWAAEEEVQKGMTAYASSFKKAADFQEHGRTQAPLTKAMLAVCGPLFEKFAPKHVCDISGIKNGLPFTKAAWFWGFSETSQKASFLP